MGLSDIGLILLAASVLCLALFIRNYRMKAYQDKLKQDIRAEQKRISPAAPAAKTGKSMAELELGGFHPTARFVFEDRDRQVPVHVEFAVDQQSQIVAYSDDGSSFDKRTFLQLNGCEIKELREYSSMVDEINLGFSSRQKKKDAAGRKKTAGTSEADRNSGGVYDGDAGWMDNASCRINSLQVILYTGRLMDAPVVLELFGRPHSLDYEKYSEARKFARDVQKAAYGIISSRVGGGDAYGES